MALTDVEFVRLLIGDTPTSPFYQIFSDDEIQQFLDANSGNVRQASRMAAIAASMQLAGWTSRERTADIEVWIKNSLEGEYKQLPLLIENKINADIFSTLTSNFKRFQSELDRAENVKLYILHNWSFEDVKRHIEDLKKMRKMGYNGIMIFNTLKNKF